MGKGQLSKLVLIFGIGWLLSFVGGCSAKLVYEYFHAPDWLNSVIVGMFIGLGCFFMSCFALTSSLFYFGRGTGTAANKGKAIYALIVGVVIFLAGLFVFWKVVLNFQALLM